MRPNEIAYVTMEMLAYHLVHGLGPPYFTTRHRAYQLKHSFIAK